MIYSLPEADAPLDQGDLIEGCPVPFLESFDTVDVAGSDVRVSVARVLILTQTCDLANDKTTDVANVALVRDAADLVAAGRLKAADVRGPLRAGRVWGWYFLPRSDEHGLPEMLVEFHQLHTVRLDLLRELCRRGKRRARVQPLYREHLARHFAETYARIGLPQPYPTD